jgi:hypothetical protein
MVNVLKGRSIVRDIIYIWHMILWDIISRYERD